MKPEDALEQIYQYLNEFKHLSERLEMVADNCKEPYNKDSCNAIATLITTNAKIVDQKLNEYLTVIVQGKIDKTLEMVIKNGRYIDTLPEHFPTQLEGQITVNKHRLDKEE